MTQAFLWLFCTACECEGDRGVACSESILVKRNAEPESGHTVARGDKRGNEEQEEERDFISVSSIILRPTTDGGAVAAADDAGGAELGTWRGVRP